MRRRSERRGPPAALALQWKPPRVLGLRADERLRDVMTVDLPRALATGGAIVLACAWVVEELSGMPFEIAGFLGAVAAIASVVTGVVSLSVRNEAHQSTRMDADGIRHGGERIAWKHVVGVEMSLAGGWPALRIAYKLPVGPLQQRVYPMDPRDVDPDAVRALVPTTVKALAHTG